MSFFEKLHENGEQSFSQIKRKPSKSPDQNKVQRVRIEGNPIGNNSFTPPPCAPSTTNSEDQAEEKILHDIIGWRKAITEDIPAIKQLQALTGDVANLIYSKNDIEELLDKNSFFPIVQYDSKGNLVSFTAYDSYPNVPSLRIFWDGWISSNYRFDDVNPRNVLFIHYMLWLPEQANRFLPLLLESLFSEFRHVKYVIIIKPPNVNIPEFYGNYFISIRPPDLNELEYNSIQSILVCLKTSVVHPLCIRSALEGELDIVVSVINRHSETTSNSDETCMLDLLSFVYQNDRKTLICELDGQVAGIMVLNLKIDLDLLDKGFELAPFNGLRKKSFVDQNSEPTFVSRHSSVKTEEYPDLLMASEFLFSQMNWEIMLNKIKGPDSFHVRTNDSTNTSSSENDSSEFSLPSLSSLSGSSIKNDTQYCQMENREKNDCSKTGDIKVAFRTSGIAMTHFFPPKYNGQCNAFVIDFFAIDINKIDEKISSFDFLEAAFRTVPDRDYCVLIIPTDFLPFPLMDLFVRVTPRSMSSFRQELYLCHKNSLSVISMRVRNTEQDDLTDINYFLKHVDGGAAVYQDILNSCFMTNNDLKSFVLTSEEKIVGVSLISCQESLERLRKYFDLSDLTLTDTGSIIKHLIIKPKYHNHARFFLRDIMRLVDVPCLYYVNSKSSQVDSSVITVLQEFFPLKPKRKAGFNELFSHIRLPIYGETKTVTSFSLYGISPRHCVMGNMHRNIVIVVVGASRTALSFLESLIFRPSGNFICYNNLICVTPHAVELLETNKQILSYMFPIRDNFTRMYSSMLSLESYVNFIYGVMTGINRSEKYIIINNKDTVRYDYLILTCGLQYLSPTPKAKEVLKASCYKNLRSSLARFLLPTPEKKKIYVPKYPNNMFIINTSKDAHFALRTIQFLMNKIKNAPREGKKIIIYGHDLHVFLTIHTLLKLGVPGDFIVFVEPFPSGTTTVTLFNDYYVDQAVLEAVKECKVICYMEYFLYDWSVSSDDYITSITFHSRTKQIVLPCLAFFPFIEKLVSEVTFNACNDAGLVYDGRLVINHNFRTNDSYIYSAGPFTKYAKRYFASEQNHQYYNSREVGQKLAEIIKEKIDPLAEVEEEEASDLVPQLKAPVFFHCQLPGDFNLFMLRKPGKKLSLETAYNFTDYGEVLTTGDCQMKKGHGYFRLHLDAEGFVQSITCYTKDRIDYVNLSCLYGLHEKILNNLLFRYDMSMINDFFAYFRQPWALALFHENFHVLRHYNNQLFYRKTSRNKNFSDEVVKKLQSNGWKPLPEGTRKELESEYLYSKLENDIKSNVMQFLENFKQDFPVYATPSRRECLHYDNTEP